MQQYGSKYFARRPPSPDPGVWGQKVKIQLFQNMVMLHIKLKGMTNAATCKHIYTQPDPWGGVKGQTFLKVVMLHIKLMGMEHRTPFKHIFRPYTHPGPLGVGSKGQNIFFTECCIPN